MPTVRRSSKYWISAIPSYHGIKYLEISNQQKYIKQQHVGATSDHSPFSGSLSSSCALLQQKQLINMWSFCYPWLASSCITGEPQPLWLRSASLPKAMTATHTHPPDTTHNLVCFHKEEP
ncbi:hypothetical protein V6N13_010847 [Hibiscus sabdariffa]|uniref:Uncharacterized protein n=1 Tax=Hibiscus sabdariffa TaxID=183260 RepID=A0ABR2SAF3_9ROSI